jgi:hypothetical protein
MANQSPQLKAVEGNLNNVQDTPRPITDIIRDLSKPVNPARLCDLKKKMAACGSKRWRAFYPESITYKMLPSLGWKH